MDDILVLKEKFNDVLFSSKNIGNWVERRTDYTFNDVLRSRVRGKSKISDY